MDILASKEHNKSKRRRENREILRTLRNSTHAAQFKEARGINGLSSLKDVRFLYLSVGCNHCKGANSKRWHVMTVLMLATLINPSSFKARYSPPMVQVEKQAQAGQQCIRALLTLTTLQAMALRSGVPSGDHFSTCNSIQRWTCSYPFAIRPVRRLTHL